MGWGFPPLPVGDRTDPTMNADPHRPARAQEARVLATAFRPVQKPMPPSNAGQIPAAPSAHRLNWARVRSDHFPSRPRCRSCSPQETKNTEEMPKKDEAKVKAKTKDTPFLEPTTDAIARERYVPVVLCSSFVCGPRCLGGRGGSTSRSY
jgi:hypothetical protein